MKSSFIMAASSFRPSMKAVVNSFIKMPYFKNHAAASGAPHNFACHEEAIEDVLCSNGFTKVAFDIYSKQIMKGWIEDVSDCPMEVGAFISQPCGIHDSPDFIVRVSTDEVIGLEAKSSRGTCPLYNSGGIKPNYLYVFCSEIMNQTTIYWGRDIITVEQQVIIDELIKQQRDLEKIANERLREIDIKHRGISYYTRPMIGQSGGREYTSYFNHANRQLCEENVLVYFD